MFSRYPKVILGMSLKSFPIIFINMGGEMVYILDQRLSAQGIVDQKSARGRKIKTKGIHE